MHSNDLNVLALVDDADVKLLDMGTGTDHWNLTYHTTDFRRLYRNVDSLHELIKELDIDFVAFSRNDQVCEKVRIGPIIRKFRTGYTTFSGIDKACRTQEMRDCHTDFLRCDNPVGLAPEDTACKKRPAKHDGSFSLVFDIEQVACVKYGLPRLLSLLNKYDVKATFFVTNIMKTVYPGLIDELSSRGHEVGIHGICHEHMPDYGLEGQRERIRYMIKDLGADISGANFIERMDNDTIRSLIDNGLRYFVFPSINHYRMFCYPKLSTGPIRITLNNREIHGIPISVETYGYAWFSIKNMIDSACMDTKKFNGHITVLCHPFRDGNLQNVRITETMIDYLVNHKNLGPVMLKDVPLGDADSVYLDHFNPLQVRLRPGELLPTTKQDYLGMLPQNFMTLYRVLMKRDIW